MTCDFALLATEGVRSLRPYQPGKPIEEVEQELGLTDVVKLASNENPLGPGELARAAFAACGDSLGRYPDSNATALKAALARHLGVGETMLTLGNGSNDVLELIARGFMSPVHEVVFSEHAFLVYALVTHAVGARAIVTPARRFGHDLEAMSRAISARTRVVFIANPNNPTGTWIAHRPLETFLQAVPADVLVVVDEAYFEYVEEPEYPNCVPWVARYPNLIVTRTFSKVYGLAALRLGYAVSNPVIADLLNRVRQPFNVNTPAQRAAMAALQDSEHLAKSLALNRHGLAQLEYDLQRMELRYIPSVGNFICVDVGRSGTDVYQALLQKGVIARPVDNYGMPNFLRVTVGREAENSRFIEALRSVLRRS
ncbi:MAG: histidinol-phosphate transaminase [Gammaproteobacteria bacterium]|jgi:histidinol-phosphate aminotransferase